MAVYEESYRMINGTDFFSLGEDDKKIFLLDAQVLTKSGIAARPDFACPITDGKRLIPKYWMEAVLPHESQLLESNLQELTEEVYGRSGVGGGAPPVCFIRAVINAEIRRCRSIGRYR